MLIFAILFIVSMIMVHEFQPAPSPEEYLENLNMVQSKSLDNIVEMNKLIISLALLIIGACAGILVRKFPTINTSTTLTTSILLTCILFAASSIFSGYILYDNVVSMLANNFFHPANEMIKWPQRLQFYSFFISVVLFGLFIVNYFIQIQVEAEPKEEKPLLVKIVDAKTEEIIQERN